MQISMKRQGHRHVQNLGGHEPGREASMPGGDTFNRLIATQNFKLRNLIFCVKTLEADECACPPA